MKKLIAITVMIALCVAAAFADTTISGAVETRLNVYQITLGNHGEDYDGGHPKAQTGGSIGTAYIQLANTNSEGTAGGTLRLRATDIIPTTASSDNFRWHKVFVWWKPIPQVKIFLGQDADGMFERGQLTSWAFHQGTEQYLVVHDWDFWRAIFPGNWDTFGLALSFYLVDGLELNLVVPTGTPGGWPRHQNSALTRTSDWDKIYPGALQLTSSYQIGDIGKVHFAWIGSGEKYDKDTVNYGKIALSFFSSMIQGLQFQVGASTDIQTSNKDIVSPGKLGTIATAPIYAGAAVHFSAGDFGVKWRLGTRINTTELDLLNGTYEKDGGYFLTTNIMPTYKLGNVGTVCLDIGVSIDQGGKQIAYTDPSNSVAVPGKSKAPDANIGFWVNPYLKKNINSGGYFQTGIMILSSIGGGQGGSHNVDAPSKPVLKADGTVITPGSGLKPRVYIPIVMGISF